VGLRAGLDHPDVGGHHGDFRPATQGLPRHGEAHLSRGTVPDKAHAVDGLPGAPRRDQQPHPLYRPAESAENLRDDGLRVGHAHAVTFHDAVAVLPQEIQVLPHGGVFCRTGVEVGGDHAEGAEAAVEAAGQAGQGLRGRRGVEHRLGRLRWLVHQHLAAEGGRSDEMADPWAENDLRPVAGSDELPDDGGHRQGAGGGSDGDQDQGGLRIVPF
jgi:hypothetical protein